MSARAVTSLRGNRAPRIVRNMVRRRSLVLRIALILATGSGSALVAGAQETAPRTTPAISAGAVAGQVSLGVVGTAVGFFGGGLAARRIAIALRSDDDMISRVAYVGAYTGGALATAVAPALIGSRGDAHGRYAAGVAGAIGGGLVSVVIRKLGRTGVFGERGPVAIVMGAAIVALPSIGATIAYNQSRRAP
jgi:hypothetical protein